jgi:hypothetical protein
MTQVLISIGFLQQKRALDFTEQETGQNRAVD